MWKLLRLPSGALHMATSAVLQLNETAPALLQLLLADAVCP